VLQAKEELGSLQSLQRHILVVRLALRVAIGQNIFFRLSRRLLLRISARPFLPIRITISVLSIRPSIFLSISTLTLLYNVLTPNLHLILIQQPTRRTKPLTSRIGRPVIYALFVVALNETGFVAALNQITVG
jgi:hypothetical protein